VKLFLKFTTFLFILFYLNKPEAKTNYIYLEKNNTEKTIHFSKNDSYGFTILNTKTNEINYYKKIEENYTYIYKKTQKFSTVLEKTTTPFFSLIRTYKEIKNNFVLISSKIEPISILFFSVKKFCELPKDRKSNRLVKIIRGPGNLSQPGLCAPRTRKSHPDSHASPTWSHKPWPPDANPTARHE